MKEYPLTSRELWLLGSLQAGAAAALSFSGWLWGFWANAQQAIAFADTGVAKEVMTQWEAYADMAWWAAILVGGLGLVLFAAGGLNVLAIIGSTKHDAKP
jgi:hypothetical protein